MPREANRTFASHADLRLSRALQPGDDAVHRLEHALTLLGKLTDRLSSLDPRGWLARSGRARSNRSRVLELGLAHATCTDRPYHEVSDLRASPHAPRGSSER
jgi:hypothetical protein